MKIELVQTEIEQALRNHINGLINIKEGTQINIDLSAGRGADGFKASIDIVAVSTGSTVGQCAQEAPVVVDEPVKAEPTPVAEPVKPVKKAAAAKKTEPKTVVQEPAEQKVETTQTEDGAATGAAQNAGEDTDDTAEATPAAEASEAKPARKSLFGGLTKPVNE